MAGDDGREQVQLDEDTLARRRVLGEDHPGTLASASGLAVSLRAAGEYRAARELGEDTLARQGEWIERLEAEAGNLAAAGRWWRHGIDDAECGGAE